MFSRAVCDVCGALLSKSRFGAQQCREGTEHEPGHATKARSEPVRANVVTLNVAGSLEEHLLTMGFERLFSG
jgi:hypothetical protein